jgi:putative PIN family toxin of toxin-antitoxin system
VKVVIDTNVLISGLLSPYGPPGEIVQMISSGTLSLCFDSRIISEYSQVMRRPKFSFRADEIDALLEQIQSNGRVIASEPLPHHLKDPHDEAFLEVAVAGKVERLVTGNLKHYPSSFRHIKVVSPKSFLEYYRKQ